MLEGDVNATTVGQFAYSLDFTRNTFLTAAVALLVTPVASLLTSPPDGEPVSRIWKAKQQTSEELAIGDGYSILPVTTAGKTGLAIFALGLAVFVTGVVLGGQGSEAGSAIAVSGMVLYFGGGLLRAWTP